MATSEQESDNAAQAPEASAAQAALPEHVAGWPGVPGPAFGPHFYLSVLPDRVVSQCQGHPDNVPVVNLHLGNGRMLDLCHIVHLTERWFAVQYFRDTETCEDMDVAFLPYDLVVMVTLSLHSADKRRIGFNIEGGPPSLSGQVADPGVNPPGVPPGNQP
jgi:hypothetical protein